MRRKMLKYFYVFLILCFTAFLGLTYVAPKVLLKMGRQLSGSTAADFGLRFDEVDILSDDSLVLKGDFIYPYHVNINEPTSDHSLIVLHPIGQNTRYLYPIFKRLTTMDINFISFDSRAHGRSEGHLYTLGIKEADDITEIVEHILELHPDHSFGIYAKGNTGNIALRALAQDPRIRYGIIESYFEDPVQQYQQMQYDDVLINWPIINNYIAKKAIDHLNLDLQRLELDLNAIDQPVLLLSTKHTDATLSKLKNNICSTEKYLQRYIDSEFLYPGYVDGYAECIKEFIDVYSIESRKYAREQVFQPSI